MVTKCVCFDVTFKQMKAANQISEAKTIEELQRVITFGLRCKLCIPYAERFLKTGETEFEVMTDY